jgi:large-conductance mechanosensitive channel
MLKEFRDFINRGNVLDLAVAVIIGAAFTGGAKLTDEQSSSSQAVRRFGDYIF